MKSAVIKMLADRIDQLQDSIKSIGSAQEDTWKSDEFYAVKEWDATGETWRIIPNFAYTTEAVAQEVADILSAKNGKTYTVTKFMILGRPL